MSKAPAFQLYAADFYMDTNTWTIEEIGIYTRLLFSEWVNGPLPNDETRLARASGCSVKRFRGGWSQVKLKFSVTEDDKLYNDRLEAVRQEQIEFQEIQRVKGIKSAKKRWAGHVTTVKPRLQPEGQPKANSPSPSPSPDVERETHLPEIPPMNRKDFDALAEMRGVPRECAEWFWNTCDSRNWVDTVGQPIRKVEPLLLNALKNWRAKQKQQPNGGKFTPPEPTAKQKAAMWGIK